MFLRSVQKPKPTACWAAGRSNAAPIIPKLGVPHVVDGGRFKLSDAAYHAAATAASRPHKQPTSGCVLTSISNDPPTPIPMALRMDLISDGLVTAQLQTSSEQLTSPYYQ